MIFQCNKGKAVYLVGFARNDKKNVKFRMQWQDSMKFSWICMKRLKECMISKRYVGKAGYLVGYARKDKKNVWFPNGMSGKQDI